MLFLLCIVFLLPYLLQVSSQSEEARDIVENARGLFNAVAKNESEMVGKFVSALRKNEEKLETAYDNLKKAMESSVRKHRHQPNFIQRNRAIKRGADSGLPDYEAEFRKIRGQMKNVKGETEREEYLLRLLVDERADCKADIKAEQKRTNDAEKDKNTTSKSMWFARVRSAIEAFEDKHGDDADVQYPTVQEAKQKHERNRLFRERVWNWIFKNKNDKNKYPRVTRLIAAIEANEEIGSVEVFSTLISHAFSDLSEYIHQEILRPGTGSWDVKYATTDPQANKAIELFMSLFEIKDYIVVKKPSEKPVV